MTTDLTSDMFAGNFIRELPRKRVPAKGRKNGTLKRCVLLRCLHCQVEFECDLSAAKRIQQKCCSHDCSKRLLEVFEGGNERHPLYSRWLSMTQRVHNPNNVNYRHYGERGISIEDGLNDFATYVDYVTSLPGYSPEVVETLQLDRVNNDGNYAKGNLRWATRNTQVANQGTNSKGINRFTGVCWSKTHQRWVARVDYEGKTYCSSTHVTEEAALQARNKCIQQHNLPHPIQTYY